jgi:hypothetical protein
MSDATRKRRLKALASMHVHSKLGSRLESVYAQVAGVRNPLAHSPININPNGADNPDDIRVGSARWIVKHLPVAKDIDRAQAQLE